MSTVHLTPGQRRNASTTGSAPARTPASPAGSWPCSNWTAGCPSPRSPTCSGPPARRSTTGPPVRRPARPRRPADHYRPGPTRRLDGRVAGDSPARRLEERPDRLGYPGPELDGRRGSASTCAAKPAGGCPTTPSAANSTGSGTCGSAAGTSCPRTPSARKTRDCAAIAGPAARRRQAGRGRDRPAAVPAAAGRVGQARRGRPRCRSPGSTPSGSCSGPSTSTPAAGCCWPAGTSAGRTSRTSWTSCTGSTTAGTWPCCWTRTAATRRRTRRTLAEDLGIELLWLPKRSPHLNPMDHLWRHGKEVVLANQQYASIDEQVERFIGYLGGLSAHDALTQGRTSVPELLAEAIMSKTICGPT